MQAKKGLIVIDNIENLNEVDKELIFEFIKKVPRTIQFVLTSRNEEPCEDKINIKEFKEIDSGLTFINEFIKVNDLQIDLTETQKKDLVTSSKGNTLIIVLALQLVDHGNNIETIISDLNNIEGPNINMIADFMYKNTINQTINKLASENITRSIC